MTGAPERRSSIERTGIVEAPVVAGVPSTPAVAWRPVLALAAGVALVLGVASAWYGPFGDELYFLAAGRRLAWGYADQPPLVPLIAATLDALAPGNLVVLRLPATLATAGNVVLAALVAAELGGRRRAQLMAAGATAISPYLLTTGHLLATSTLDPVLWTALLWLLVRWVRTERDGRPDDRLLLAGGLVVNVAMVDKMLVPVLLVGLVAGVVTVGPRRLLRRPLLWVGLALAAASTVPTLLWQAANGWPQLQMGSVVAGEGGLTGNRWCFLPFAAWDAGLIPGAVLVGLGVWALVRTPALRPWRFLGVAVLVTTVLLIVAGGRPYYVVGLFPALFAAGAVAVQQRGPLPRWWGWTVSVPVYVLSGVIVAVLSLPLGPASWRVSSDFVAMGQVGWTSLTDDVATAYRSLPPERRSHTTVLAYSYWYASALDRYGPSRGLPEVHSGHRGFGFFGPPPDDASAAILVGRVQGAAGFCRDIVALPTHVDPSANAGMNGVVPLALCTPRAPWSQLWPEIRRMQ